LEAFRGLNDLVQAVRGDGVGLHGAEKKGDGSWPNPGRDFTRGSPISCRRGGRGWRR
jgi:hypothetical protein